MKRVERESVWRRAQASAFEFVCNAGLDQQALGLVNSFTVNQHPFGQNAKRSFSDAHILVGDEMGNARIAQQRLDEGNDDRVIGADKFKHGGESGRGPTGCKLGSVRHRIREHIDHNDAGDDQAKADDRRKVEFLAEHHKADDRDQHDAEPTPDCIGDADGQRFERD